MFASYQRADDRLEEDPSPALYFKDSSRAGLIERLSAPWEKPFTQEDVMMLCT